MGSVARPKPYENPSGTFSVSRSIPWTSTKAASKEDASGGNGTDNVVEAVVADTAVAVCADVAAVEAETEADATKAEAEVEA